MTNYRRNFVLGGSFFFTVNLAERRSQLLTERVGLLRAAFLDTRARHPFAIEAIVILPDHLHAIWTLPEGDADFMGRLGLYPEDWAEMSGIMTEAVSVKGDGFRSAQPILRV